MTSRAPGREKREKERREDVVLRVPSARDVCMLLLPANPYVARSGRSLQLQERVRSLTPLVTPSCSLSLSFSYTLSHRRPLSLSARGNIRMHWDVHSEVFRIRVLGGPQLLSSRPLFSQQRQRATDASRLHIKGENLIFSRSGPIGETLCRSPLKDDPQRRRERITPPPSSRSACIDWSWNGSWS